MVEHRRSWRILTSILLLLCAGHACPAADRPSRFLIVSDIHFNPFSDPSLVPKLAASDPQHWDSVLNTSKSLAYSQYGEDTNWWLLRSALDAMRTTLPHPALVMVAGDLLAHEFQQKFTQTSGDGDPEHYQAFVVKTLIFVTQQLRRRFPGTEILVTPGNNDDSCSDYHVEPDGPLLRDTAGAVQRLARGGPEVAAEWRALGSYSVDPKGLRGVRILSLNSIFFSNLYGLASPSEGCAGDPSHSGDRAMAWLEDNLHQAQAAGKKVWLMMHIPPGFDGYSTMVKLQGAGASCRASLVPYWKPAFTERFAGLLQKYQGTVAAVFAGHTHSDDVRLLNRGSSFVLINPPISPVFRQNPGFRVVTVGGGGSVADISTLYVTNLVTATRDVPGHWAPEYDFDQEWAVRQVDAASLAGIYQRALSDPQDAERWFRLLSVSSGKVRLSPLGQKVFLCASGNVDAEGFAACACAP